MCLGRGRLPSLCARDVVDADCVAGSSEQIRLVAATMAKLAGVMLAATLLTRLFFWLLHEEDRCKACWQKKTTGQQVDGKKQMASSSSEGVVQPPMDPLESAERATSWPARALQLPEGEETTAGEGKVHLWEVHIEFAERGRRLRQG